MAVPTMSGSYGWQAAPQGATIRSFVIVFRHGARAPSKGAYGPFGNCKDVAKDWTKPDGSLYLDEVTPVGRAQCIELGKWTKSVLEKRHPQLVSDDEKLRWRSSSVNRVEESGKSFWIGFRTTKESRIEPFDSSDPDSYFRFWQINKDYHAAISELKKSGRFSERATKNLTALKEVCKALECDLEKMTPAEILSSMTYFREMIECEKYLLSDVKTSISFLGEYDLRNFKVTPKTFLNRLSLTQMDHINEAARWVWSERFFGEQFRSQIGAKLWAGLVADLAESSPKHFLGYSAHDYTIMALLCTLGVPSHPHHLFGFCSNLLIESYQISQTGKIGLYIYLNAAPFETSDFQPTAEVNEKMIEAIRSPSGSLLWDLEDLQKRFPKL